MSIPTAALIPVEFSQDKQVVERDLESKQVVAPAGLERVYEDKQCAHLGDEFEQKFAVAEPHKFTDTSNASTMRYRRRWCVGCAVVLLVLLAIILPVSLVLTRKKRSSPPPNAETALPLNTTGEAETAPPLNTTVENALRGTRLAVMDPAIGGDLYLYYQTFDGRLHITSQSVAHVWQGTIEMNIEDAKLGTPLCAGASYANDSILWWLFYVDPSNVIRNVYSNGESTVWLPGSIGSKGYKVPDRSGITFALGRGPVLDENNGGLYGDLSLYSSNEEGSVQEYIYDHQADTWAKGYTFPRTNGLRSASIWSTSTNASLYTVNDDQAMEFWWRNYNNVARPPDKSAWNRGTASAAPLASNGSMCALEDFSFQGADGKIHGSEFNGSGTSLASQRWGDTYDISKESAIEGSALTCWHFPRGRDTRFLVFYQVEGNGIMEARRWWQEDFGAVAGNWSYEAVPIG